MSGATLLFFHANGFPTGVYRQFLDALRAQLHGSAQVLAPEIIDTPVDCKPRERWPAMLQSTLAFVDAAPGSQVVLVGHSMGGYLALQAAAARSKRVKQVILLDAPLPTGWKRLFLSAAQTTGIAVKGGPAPIAARRRFEWSSIEEARQLFETKRFIQRWRTGVLEDFLEHGLIKRADGSLTLRIPRETERDIYAFVASSVALRAYRKLVQRGVPIAFIAGRHSRETRMVGYAKTRHMFGRGFVEMDASHLLPMEHPQLTARNVVKALTW